MVVRSLRFLSLILIAMVILNSTAIAQESGAPASKKLKFRKVSTPPGISELAGVHALVAMNKKSAIAFGTAKSTDGGSWSLVSYRISNKGKAFRVNVIDYLSTNVAAIWNPGSSSTPPADASGLLFYDDSPGGKIVIKVAKFDFKGKLIGSKKDLFEILIPAGHFFTELSLSAAAGSESAAVAVNLKTYNGSWDAPSEVYAYILEVDFEGNLIGSAARVPLPNGGKYYSIALRKPVLFGSNWLTPCLIIDHKKSESSVAVVVKGKSKVKVITVRKPQLSEDYEWKGGGAQFLPGVPTPDPALIRFPPAAKTVNLLIQRVVGLPYQPLNMRKYDIFHTRQRVKKNGRKSGNPTDLDVEQWTPKLSPDVNKSVVDHREYVSYAAVHKDGRLIMAKARYIRRSWSTSPAETLSEVEHQLLLFAFDPETGEVEVLASVSPNMDYIVVAPILAVSGGKTWVITNYKKVSDKNYVPYLSYF